MSPLINTRSLPDEAQKLFLPFMEKFITGEEEHISSVFIYGSATGRNFIPRSSDINSVVIVRSISLGLMSRFLKKMTAANKRIRAPLIFTEDHVRSSLDVFPIEFLEMRENYTLIYGEDFLRDIAVEDRHARLFCEQQIKGKIIRLRQGYLESNGKKNVIETMLKESFNTLSPVFRTILKIKKIKPSPDKGEVLNQLKDVFAISVTAMTLIWKDKKNDERISGRDVHEVFGQYLDELEILAGIADRMRL